MPQNSENFSFLSKWPLLRQFRTGDLFAFGDTVKSERSEHLEPRTKRADRVTKSICPYCAVGCGQNVYVKDERFSTLRAIRIRPSPSAASVQKARPVFNLSPEIIVSRM